MSDGYSRGGEQGGIKRPVSAGNPPREEQTGGEAGDGGEERRRGWLLCHGKHMLLAVSSSRRGDASPSTALQTVWHRGHRRKPLERSEPPASSVERVCVRTLRVRRRVLRVCPYVAAYAFQMEHWACSIIGRFSPHTMSETHNMAAVQRNPRKGSGLSSFL